MSSTMDEILKRPKESENKPKVFQNWESGKLQAAPGDGSDKSNEPELAEVGRDENSGTTAAPADNAGLSNVEIFRRNFPIKTQEEMEREEKRAKRDRLFASIGDGIAAISNLITATKGAPSVYDGRNSMSERARARWDKLRKEHEANKQAYLNGYMRAVKLDEDRANTERAWKRQLGLYKENQRRYDEGIAYRDEKDKKEAEYKASVLAETNRHNTENESISRRRAETYATNAAKKSSGQGRAKRKLKIGDDTFEYDTSEEYRAAVIQKAKEMGIPTYDDVVVQEASKHGGTPAKKRRVNRRIEDIAADVQARGAGKPESNSGDNTPPSRRDNNDNTPPSRRK